MVVVAAAAAVAEVVAAVVLVLLLLVSFDLSFFRDTWVVWGDTASLAWESPAAPPRPLVSSEGQHLREEQEQGFPCGGAAGRAAKCRQDPQDTAAAAVIVAPRHPQKLIRRAPPPAPSGRLLPRESHAAVFSSKLTPSFKVLSVPHTTPFSNSHIVI